jgi:hypothetical protein
MGVRAVRVAGRGPISTLRKKLAGSTSYRYAEPMLDKPSVLPTERSSRCGLRPDLTPEATCAILQLQDILISLREEKDHDIT